MKNFLIAVAFPLTSIAAGIPIRTRFEGAYTAGVWRQPFDNGPPFYGDGINASGGKFFLNKNASTYCPSNVTNLDCSTLPGDKTVFVGGNGTLSLDVAVPGGQQVYVASDGTLSYTTAHSAYMPEGSISTGFWREMSQSFGAPINLGLNERNWYICPTEGSNGTLTRTQVYQVYLVSGGKQGCLGFSMRTYTPADIVAWQYA